MCDLIRDLTDEDMSGGRGRRQRPQRCSPTTKTAALLREITKKQTARKSRSEAEFLRICAFMILTSNRVFYRSWQSRLIFEILFAKGSIRCKYMYSSNKVLLKNCSFLLLETKAGGSFGCSWGSCISNRTSCSRSIRSTRNSSSAFITQWGALSLRDCKTLKHQNKSSRSVDINSLHDEAYGLLTRDALCII